MAFVRDWGEKKKKGKNEEAGSGASFSTSVEIMIFKIVCDEFEQCPFNSTSSCWLPKIHRRQLRNQGLFPSSSWQFLIKTLWWFYAGLHIMQSVAGLACVNMSRCQRPALICTHTHAHRDTHRDTHCTGPGPRASLSIQVSVNINVQ